MPTEVKTFFDKPPPVTLKATGNELTEILTFPFMLFVQAVVAFVATIV